jgi:hypothetical protein
MVDQTSELQPLAVSPFGQQDSHLFDNGAQIEIEVLKIQLVRFDFREIEDIIDNG